MENHNVHSNINTGLSWLAKEDIPIYYYSKGDLISIDRSAEAERDNV